MGEERTYFPGLRHEQCVCFVTFKELKSWDSFFGCWTVFLGFSHFQEATLRSHHQRS